jgi:hypothetical protein
MPANLSSGSEAIFSARTPSGGTRFEMELIADFVRWRIQRSGGNQIAISLDYPFSEDTVVMWVLRQNGTQVDWFMNGVLRDGSDIGTTITGTATGSDWLHTLQAVNGDWRWAVGADGNNNNNRRFSKPIYDFWISRTVLTDAQIRDLWDLAAGNVASAAAP